MAVASATLLLALHGLRLQGIAEADAVADHMLVERGPIRDELATLEAVDLVRYRHGRMPGYMLTPEGRVVGERLLTEELDEHGLRPQVQAAYEEFLGFNRRLLGVCTAWQLRTVGGTSIVNDHTDPEHDAAVLDDLVALDARVRPVLITLTGLLDRFAGHGRRLQYALDQVLAGEHDWFTKPMFPSYHSCWFELHEDLLATLGAQRQDEERTTEGSP